MEFSCPARRPFHDIAYGDRNGDRNDEGRATALVSDVHTAELAYTPYQRPPDRAALLTAIPRGLRSFVVRGAVLALKPVNDTELLSISITLPGGFGYVINECHVNISADRAEDWETTGLWRISQPSTAARDFDYRLVLDFPLASQNGILTGIRGTNIPAGTLPRTPLIPGVSGATQSLAFSNLAASATVAGVVDALVSFWEYDLEQLAYFPVHSAANVITR